MDAPRTWPRGPLSSGARARTHAHLQRRYRRHHLLQIAGQVAGQAREQRLGVELGERGGAQAAPARCEAGERVERAEPQPGDASPAQAGPGACGVTVPQAHHRGGDKARERREIVRQRSDRA